MLGEHPCRIGLAAGITLLLSVSGAGAGSKCPGHDGRLPRMSDFQAAPIAIDAVSMFDQVVERYRSLQSYQDNVVIEQVTARNGELSTREETRVSCEIADGGELEVTSPSAQIQDYLGIGSFMRGNPAMEAIQQEYRLWLAPHLSLRYADEPLEEFRSGIDEGFTPIKASTVTVEDEELVRLDLQSGDGLSEDCRARFELYINPRTLLIVRVRGSQLLPDGANLLTDILITPRQAITSDGEELSTTTRTTT